MPLIPSIWLAVSAGGCIWLILKLHDYLKKHAHLKTTPLRHILLAPGSFVAEMFPPTMNNISKGCMYPFFVSKHTPYTECGWNCYSSLSPIPRNTVIFWVADAAVIKEIASNPKRFPKATELYRPLTFFGPSVLTVEGDTWKRHRRVSQPAFSESNHRLVWDAGLRIMTELMNDVWSSKEEVLVADITKITIRIALVVFAIAGFGQPMSWDTDSSRPLDREMSFPTAMTLSTTRVVLKMILPTWALSATQVLRETRTAFKELELYMNEMILERKNADRDKLTKNVDLLTNLVAVSEQAAGMEDGVIAQLSLTELRGNVFLYLIAGHETNAHALAYTLGLLALYPDEQSILYQHIQSIIGDRVPTYEDFDRLMPVLWAYYEALRMFPPVTVIPKHATQDEIFNVSSSAADPNCSETKAMPVPAGATIFIHPVAVHYNPRYWKDPYTFRPGRFSEKWDRDAFLSFSAGVRSCVGRKFAEVEAVSVLTSLLLTYSVHLTAETTAELSGLSKHEQTERFLRSEAKLTLTPVNVPLIFKRRN